MNAESCVLSTPIGRFALWARGGFIVQAAFVDSAVTAPESGLLKNADKQISEYFAGNLTEFDLPLLPSGTAFQQNIWNLLRGIAYGKIITYGQMSQLSGKPGAARAVGSACGANPLPLLIPCHRVTASNGGLGGFSCGLWRKEYLLELEGAEINFSKLKTSSAGRLRASP
jgi:methylated-DNA-[protein]-cysteine S-methyltransferase